MLCYFIRHAHHDLLGRELVGRRPGVALSAAGLAEAEALATALASARFAHVFTSPQLRARQTAEAIARAQELAPEDAAALDEVDFGHWTGLSFAALRDDPHWHDFNRSRTRVPIPGGESMPEVAERVVGFVAALARASANGAIACVTHGDVIRASLVTFLGMPLDLIERIDIAPASVSVVEVASGHCRVRAVNLTLAGLAWRGTAP